MTNTWRRDSPVDYNEIHTRLVEEEKKEEKSESPRGEARETNSATRPKWNPLLRDEGKPSLGGVTFDLRAIMYALRIAGSMRLIFFNLSLLCRFLILKAMTNLKRCNFRVIIVNAIQERRFEKKDAVILHAFLQGDSEGCNDLACPRRSSRRHLARFSYEKRAELCVTMLLGRKAIGCRLSRREKTEAFVMAGRVGDDASDSRQDITGRREAGKTEEGRRHPGTAAGRGGTAAAAATAAARAKISEGNARKGERAKKREEGER
ncbi:hypothetical protein ALC62_03930 [Cyphomyrmex costatus]|uniref:Uncharacterized protein n=1 Tax=Cyphomyrmex costatus TaxID=456900 RepID=A0A195CWV7_9HYME|nr:hypothetical protein ALC62_03930 [Cyphomyrmex costatus]